MGCQTANNGEWCVKQTKKLLSVLKRNRAYVVPVNPLGTAGNVSVKRPSVVPVLIVVVARSDGSNSPSLS